MQIERPQLGVHIDLVAGEVQSVTIDFADLEHIQLLEELQPVLLIESRQQILADRRAINGHHCVVVTLGPIRPTSTPREQMRTFPATMQTVADRT